MLHAGSVFDVLDDLTLCGSDRAAAQGGGKPAGWRQAPEQARRPIERGEGTGLAVALDEGTREYFFHSPAKSYWGEFIAALAQNSIRWVCRDAFHGKNCKWE